MKKCRQSQNVIVFYFEFFLYVGYDYLLFFLHCGSICQQQTQRSELLVYIQTAYSWVYFILSLFQCEHTITYLLNMSFLIVIKNKNTSSQTFKNKPTSSITVTDFPDMTCITVLTVVPIGIMHLYPFQRHFLVFPPNKVVQIIWFNCQLALNSCNLISQSDWKQFGCVEPLTECPLLLNHRKAKAISYSVAPLTGRGRGVWRPCGGAVYASAEGGGAVGGEGSTGGGAAEAAGKHGDRERRPQRQDGCRGGRAAAA